MKNNLVKLAFILPGLLILSWGAFYHFSIQSWSSITLPITGYDPRNLLSGHYIQYEIQWNKIDCNEVFKGSCPKANFAGRNRFYVPESNAKKLDELLARNSNNEQFSIVYAYKLGEKAIAKKLLINNIVWSEYLKQ